MKWRRKDQHQPDAEKKKKKTTKNSNKKPYSVPFFSRILAFFCLSQLSIKPTPRPPSNPKRSTEHRPMSDCSLLGPPAPPQTPSSPCSPPACCPPLTTPTITSPSSNAERVVTELDSPWRTPDRSAAEDWFFSSPSRPRISTGVQIRDRRPPIAAENRLRSPGSDAGGPCSHRGKRGGLSPPRSGQDFFRQRGGRRKRWEEAEEREERESFAATKYSRDPHKDFRESMTEMIAEEGIGRPEELEKLLACYLCLNSDEHHDAIVQAFRSVWSELNRDQVGSQFVPESVPGYG